ncbi:Gfo/Idh/MocA family protein [Streptomyces uncialis]|uniref:Gfo/Idh/MocA family protein n=1 Tax=Streptomyces uncialis TaxID=1048205 RepID=UPI00386CB9AD|nr:Gfo/Idh/MocA family oxidoreductase [Streptomyces uncialis]
MTEPVNGTAGPTGPRDLVVGLLGAGAMARAHLPAWLALGARVTVLSVSGRAAELARPYQDRGVTVARDLGELLGGCDIVDICTPTPSHRELALAAIAAGRPVVCEKPLALTTEDAALVARTAEAAGVPLFPAHVVRYFPAYAAAARAVAAGRIGTPSALRFTRAGAYPVWAPWFADPALSGGILVDQMIHDMDFARLLAGEVVRVHARVRVGRFTDGDGPDRPGHPTASGTALLTHASGAVSRLLGVWGRPGLPFRTTFRVSGPDGVLEHDSTAGAAGAANAVGRPGGARAGRTGSAPGGVTAAGAAGAPAGDRDVEAPAGGSDVEAPGGALPESPYLTQLREFAAAVAGGPPPGVSAWDGVAAVRIATAAAESARTGKPVELSGPLG